MLTYKHQTTTFTLKPESLYALKTTLEKLDKKLPNPKLKADKRLFPKHTGALISTAAYVRAYLAINGCHGGAILVDDGTVYSTNDTVWPTDEDSYEEVTE